MELPIPAGDVLEEYVVIDKTGYLVRYWKPIPPQTANMILKVMKKGKSGVYEVVRLRPNFCRKVYAALSPRHAR